MDQSAAEHAARLLWDNWRSGTRIVSLPEAVQPRDRADGYAVQAAVARLSGQSVSGWKIAATSTAGQAHIGVDGPIAGRLLSARVLFSGAQVPIANNCMKVAEAEFAFRMKAPLPKRERAYRLDEVLDAVESIHPAIEIPDSRYSEFVKVGAPQLIADNACACWFVLGPPASVSWRDRSLAKHRVKAFRNNSQARDGSGANVLDDPALALTWIANELRTFADGLRGGDIVTTGTCVAPFGIAPGDRIRADFGDLGEVSAELTA